MEFIWLLIASILVFFMQAGFLCLETGKIRSKNSINVAAKNVADFIVAAIIFWLFGFALMFGDSVMGLFGFSHFVFGEQQSPFQVSFFLFQLMFCGTAATLMSGAVAERISFMGYLCTALILSAIIYPICGHWAWASFFNANNQGWLEARGFVDFAGSTVVHSVGGWVALAATIIIGPRLGRFNTDKAMPVGNNIPLSALGTLLIWVGWFGFNGGSTLFLNAQVPSIILNTCIAAVWSCLVATGYHYLRQRYIDVSYMLNGIIAGLVAITASCHAVTSVQAMLIGMGAGLVLYAGTIWLEKLKIDDALGVIPTHLLAGIWGTIAVALLGDLTILDSGLSRIGQLKIQLIGICSIGAYAFGLSFIALRLINRWLPLRVSKQDELRGINISEHRASTELIDLLGSMENQQTQADFSTAIPAEPFTEVGQIADQYNRVIARVNSEISKRDNAIDKFQVSEKRKSALLNSSMDSIITVDLNGFIIEFNPAAERTFGHLKTHVQGKCFIDLFVLKEDRQKIRESLQHQFFCSEGLIRDRRNPIMLTRSSGDYFPAEVTITAANFDSQTYNEFILHIRDVTRQIKLQDKLKLQAYSDPLTGLYNRSYFIEALSTAKKFCHHSSEIAVLFFLDLDRFKKINDTLGHQAGDTLLCEVANRLISVTREQDLIARWGGDEFVILLCGQFTEAFVCQKAEKILEIMRQPLELAGRTITIPTSIGITIDEQGSYAPDQMVQYADLAMYEAKECGRDNYRLFEANMAQLSVRHFNYEQEMKKSLYSEQFYLVYQPKFTSDKRIVSLEALLRWQHPTEGLIRPDEFIPLAEESDLIITLGERVIDSALAQFYQWRQQGLAPVAIAVNISGRHLISGQLESYVEQKLQHYQIGGHYLEIEITEGVLLTDIERCIEVMSALKQLDVKLAIDDFGTGYSSLNYLKRLPIDVLKIDRSFVDECATTLEDSQICSTIINLAHNLDLITVAEGVENESQFTFLTQKGCQLFQGFYLQKPSSAEIIAQQLPASLPCTAISEALTALD